MRGLVLRLHLPILLVACGGPPAPRLTPIGPWRSQAGLDHPLVGRAWADGAFIEVDSVPQRLATAHYVLIGEQHDHPDHHRLQAWMLGALLRAGPRTTAFEMLDDGDREATAQAKDPMGLAHAVAWDKSGWPAFELYIPVFQAIFAGDGTIVPAHPDHATLKGVMTDGLASWPDTRIVRLGLDRPLPPEQAAALAAEIVESHCGHAPPAMVPAMVTAQRVKDAWMAGRLAEAGERQPVVLIAGNGHTRRDRGVPAYLFHDPRPALAVGLLPVHDEHTAPTDYPVEAYDLVIFTPRESDLDPCERFKAQLEAMKKGVKKSATP